VFIGISDSECVMISKLLSFDITFAAYVIFLVFAADNKHTELLLSD